MSLSDHLGTLAAATHIVITAAFATRALMQRHPPSTTLAWLLLIVGVPYFGAVLYLFIGERQLGRRRGRHASRLLPLLVDWVRSLPAEILSTPNSEARWFTIRRTAQGAAGLPSTIGNHLSLRSDSGRILADIAADIDAARHTILIEFYIWHPGGQADDVAAALIRAAQRGVVCRVLLDAAGSRDFFRSDWPARLREGGVSVVEALPVGLLRAAFVRFDLRLHRKIIVVDGLVAWTGSLNLVDPLHFKQDAGVGEWVDAMARIEGPVVEMLAGVVLWDWCIETGEALGQVAPGLADALAAPVAGGAEVQVLPSGPGFEGESAHRLLLATLYAARAEIVLTTPYFVPDEPLFLALEAAALRGVSVTVIVPARVDSILVRHASRWSFEPLLEAGVRILQFNDGLLHTKSVTVDRSLALFGTTNLDIRSFRLNFEVTLVIYDQAFTAEIRALQDRYAQTAIPLDAAAWARRSTGARLAESGAHLVSPLL
ncbi:cardiolipin synthase [Niveibacterium sp. 24ML]|uniref:cardiolipin synthase n=1 Tax=Niveibacterium sp. 24ML TaxID=2985512 RepID=UPI00226FD06F|nr:cardiolipin synthase [Niveibacterium sp. 24ML]MCX9157128.1 cardiolipin synthase [Niveibacterium sp. 24ML]